MGEKLGHMLRLAMAVVVVSLFAACGGGPSDSDFVAACMIEGQATASQMLDKEMGVTREAFCKCGAPIARSSLSSDGYQAMVFQMEGKREEASAITAKMSESEQEASVKVLGDMLEKCAGATR